MILSLYIIIILLAAGCSYLVISTNQINNIVFAVCGIFLWGYAGFSSFNVETISNTGVTTSHNYGFLAILFFAFSVILIIGALEEGFNTSIIQRGT